MMLEPLVFADHEALSQHAAIWLAECCAIQPDALLCLAAGSTPSRMYHLFAERMRTGAASELRFIKLDEWGGLAMNNPVTCEQQLRRELIDPLGAAERYVAFESSPPDPVAECARIAGWLAANGPIDVAILGLGMNGHLGFNEPAVALHPHAHIAELSGDSLGHVMIQGSTDRPQYGLTLGMADLLQAREVLLLVSGAAKRAPLERLLSGEITTDFPASLLQLHPRVTLLCAAAARPG
jgi:galactosamine-6-phosphate isomerase